jgi:hypothetical protein
MGVDRLMCAACIVDETKTNAWMRMREIQLAPPAAFFLQRD